MKQAGRVGTAIIMECQWFLPARLWNRLMHALHGNQAARDGAMVDLDGDFDGDLEGLGELEYDERYELEILMNGIPIVTPMIVLWQADDGSAAVAVPAWAIP